MHRTGILPASARFQNCKSQINNARGGKKKRKSERAYLKIVVADRLKSRKKDMDTRTTDDPAEDTREG